MTIDTRHVNNLGPRKFRTGEKNDKKQVCHYNDNKKDRAFNRVLAVRKQTSTDAIIFSITNLENLTFINVLIIQPEPAIRRTFKADKHKKIEQVKTHKITKLTLLMMKKKKIKERVEKRERKRQEVAEKTYSKSEKKG